MASLKDILLKIQAQSQFESAKKGIQQKLAVAKKVNTKTKLGLVQDAVTKEEELFSDKMMPLTYYLSDLNEAIGMVDGDLEYFKTNVAKFNKVHSEIAEYTNLWMDCQPIAEQLLAYSGISNTAYSWMNLYDDLKERLPAMIEEADRIQGELNNF